jgi:hypothetical protein
MDRRSRVRQPRHHALDGGTGKAAALEGFRFIGCEMDGEYVDIAKARIAFVGGEPAETVVLAQAAITDALQLDIFANCQPPAPLVDSSGNQPDTASAT